MYRIDRTSLRKQKNTYSMFFIIGIIGISFVSFYLIPRIIGALSISELGLRIALPLIFFGGAICLYCISFIISAVNGVKIYKKTMSKYDYLEQNGRLVKDLPYCVQETGMVVKGRPVIQIVVEYELYNGSVVQLFADRLYGRQFISEYRVVDILIDPNDPNNYYIDFHIEEN